MNTSTPTNKDALLRAIAVIGSQTAFGAVLGKAQGFVSYWLKTGRLPVEHCPDIEEATRDKGQVVTCEELRPDVNWAALRKKTRRTKEPARTEG